MVSDETILLFTGERLKEFVQPFSYYLMGIEILLFDIITGCHGVGEKTLLMQNFDEFC